MTKEVASLTAASPQKQQPNAAPSASPWKKPQRPMLKVGKSLKRKSDIFNNSASCGSALNESSHYNSFSGSQQLNSGADDHQLKEQSPKRKSLFNRFSINNSGNLSFGFGSTRSPRNNDSISEKNELYNFFNSNKREPDVNESSHQEEKPTKTKDTPLSINPEFVKNMVTSLTNNSLILNSESSSKSKEPPKITYQFEHESFVPIDWSLKTKLRIISTKEFSCCNNVKSQHESEAILNFSKFNGFYDSLNQHELKSRSEKQDLFKTLFSESISYWMFPFLPWLNLYPRNTVFSNLASEPLNSDIQKSLGKSWNASFKSLYNSLKSNQCPYFYVLTHSFTVLFKAQNIGDDTDEMCAILTPSTKGLRHSLKDITFTMPLAPHSQAANLSKKSESSDVSELANSMSRANGSLNASESIHSPDVTAENGSVHFSLGPTGEADETADVDRQQSVDNKENTSASEATATTANEKKNKKKSNGSDQNEENDEDDDDEENEEDDSDEPDEWLEQIGLNSAVNFKASVLQRNTKNQQKDSLYNFDKRPNSALYFNQSSDVQALFNFLLNSSSTVMMSSGPLSGIPPTLIAPTAFVGATLHKNRVEQNVIKSLTDNNVRLTQYTVDLTGPIMPFHVHRLANLLRVTQEGEFEMSAIAYDQSHAFNCVPRKLAASSSNVRPCVSSGGESSPILSMSPVSSSNQESSNDATTSIDNVYLDLSEKRSLMGKYGVFGTAAFLRTVCCKERKFCCNV